MEISRAFTRLCPRFTKHSGWLPVLIGAFALMVATTSPALADANIITSSVSISPGTLDSSPTAESGIVTITLINTGTEDAVVDVQAFVPSSLTVVTAPTTVQNVFVPVGGAPAATYITFEVKPAAPVTSTRRVTITVGFQSRNFSAPDDTRNQLFLRFASVRVTP